MAENEELEKQLQAYIDKLARRLWLVLLASGLGIGGVVGTGQLERFARPNPFTALDGKELEKRIETLEHWKIVEKIDCQAWREGIANKIEATEFRIRKDMPPAATKARIRALERAMERAHIEFEAPTQEWQ